MQPSSESHPRPRPADALEPGSFAYYAFTRLPGLLAALKASLTGGKPEGEA